LARPPPHLEMPGSMRVKVRPQYLPAGRRMIVMSSQDARSAGLRAYDRVRVSLDGRGATAMLSIVEGMISPGEAVVSLELRNALGLSNGGEVSVALAGRPKSFEAIRKKMRGEALTPEEIRSIVMDVANYELGELEIAAFLLSQEFRGMSMDEVEALTKAMVEAGSTVDFGRPVYEKHSIGGVPGNKVSLLIVPIAASLGVFIPKTSSRAITSPAGTADTMEVLADVEFGVEEYREIALRAEGCIVWGGKLGLAPVDDIFIRVEHPLAIDPPSQMLASIFSKKLAVGIRGLVMDIPTGRGAKVETLAEAERLASQFVELGRRFDVRVQCGITYGGQPVGHAVGPALEAREALEALMGGGPASLIEKSTSLAGLLLELSGVAPRGTGQEAAKEALRTGRALKKMREMIEAQGGDPKVKPEDIPVGEYRVQLKAPADGYVTGVDNASIATIARLAGAPSEKGAGVLLHAKQGYKVRRGDVLLEIFAERESKLTEAYEAATRLRPVTVEGMLLRRVPEYL